RLLTEGELDSGHRLGPAELGVERVQPQPIRRAERVTPDRAGQLAGGHGTSGNDQPMTMVNLSLDVAGRQRTAVAGGSRIRTRVRRVETICSHGDIPQRYKYVSEVYRLNGIL